jgi:hypothetical protein
VRPRTAFELRIVGLGEADLAVELYQERNGSGAPRRIVAAKGQKLQAVTDHLLEALRSGGHRPTDLQRRSGASLRLPEEAGVRLGLVLLATKPLRKIRRIEEVSAAVRSMSTEEAYYWFAKCTDRVTGPRAQRAFRDLWSGR